VGRAPGGGCAAGAGHRGEGLSQIAGIRRAVDTDLAELLGLVREFCTVDHHPYEESRIVAGLGPLLAGDGVGQVWVLEEATGALVGYAVVVWGWSLEAGGRESLLDELYVRERGRGAGSRLLEVAIGGARDAGALCMFLETELANERVRGFYGRHGFALESSVWMFRQL
jgi:GNAT superfamily N-acetyltransferase